MHAIDYNPIVKELIRLAKEFNNCFINHSVAPAENGTILCCIKKSSFAINFA